MTEEKDVFCKIVAGEMPANKIYEDSDFIAILDLFPIAKGQTLVIPKKHMSSSFSDCEDGDLAGLVVASKKVANILKERLPAKRVALVFEGLDVDHLHAKLFPDKGIMHMGARASDQELAALQKRITGR